MASGQRSPKLPTSNATRRRKCKQIIQENFRILVRILNKQRCNSSQIFSMRIVDDTISNDHKFRNWIRL